MEVQNPQEVASYLRKEKDPEVKVKLIFLNLLISHKMDIKRASEAVGIGLATGYKWLQRWNDEGYKGLLRRADKGGRPPRLGISDLERLKSLLKGRPYWTTSEIRELIRKEFDVSLSESQVRRILKGKLQMHLLKPYPEDYRRPEEAESILAQDLEDLFQSLEEAGYKRGEVALGYVDESSPQPTANTVRVWSWQDRVTLKKNTSRMRANSIGFYPWSGEPLIEFGEDAKEGSFCRFLEKLRSLHRAFKVVVVILDNFVTHKSRKVRQIAQKLGIFLVYLPPYCPDLNPIEFIWKSIKRVISSMFIRNLEDMREIMREHFYLLARKLSFAKSWIRKFAPYCLDHLYASAA